MSRSAESVPVEPLIRSMTGFGRAVEDRPDGLAVEIRSVNGRFLKVNCKLPAQWRGLEDACREFLGRQGVRRGSVEIQVSGGGSNGTGAWSLNEAVLEEYARQTRKLARKLKLEQPCSLDALLGLPGVVAPREEAEEQGALAARLEAVLERALVEWNRMRAREGAALAEDIRRALSALKTHCGVLRQAAPERLEQARLKFRERLRRLLEGSGFADFSEEQLEREMILLADRLDVSEELQRLESHLGQMEATLRSDGECGKKLDFLCQELFREINTLGSKAQDEGITHRVIEMKGWVERLREQVQNLE